MAKTYQQMLEECQGLVEELFPWDVEAQMTARPDTLLLDVREPYEFDRMHIAGSLCVPRGILETACEWDFEETVPELVQARKRPILVICRSGNRSLLAARQMQLMGYEQVYSLRTGLRGWNDYELPLEGPEGARVELDDSDEYFANGVRPDQLRPRPQA